MEGGAKERKYGIEMAFVTAIGDSCMEVVGPRFTKDKEISTSGRIESFLKGSKVKRSRYSHQVTLATLARFAYDCFKSQNRIFIV